MAGNVTMNAKGAKKKLQRWMKAIKDTNQTRAELTPTEVIHELSRRKGTTLLASISRSKAKKVKREGIKRTKAAVKKGGPTLLRRLAKEYRRWAYRHIEELYVGVRDSASWGTVTATTQSRKEASPAHGGAADGLPASSYGVRHKRPDWKPLQKGKRTEGKRPRSNIGTGQATLKVWYRGRLISAPEVRG